MILAYVFKMHFERIVKNQNVQKCIAVAQNVEFVLSERTHFANLMLGLIWGWASIASSSLWKLRSSAPGKLHWAVSWIPGFPLMEKARNCTCFCFVHAPCTGMVSTCVYTSHGLDYQHTSKCSPSLQKLVPKKIANFLWNAMRYLTAKFLYLRISLIQPLYYD